MSKFLDLTGQTFTYLEAICRVNSDRKGVQWKCRCSCGKFVVIASNHLRSGATKSCGCFREAIKTTHGRYKTPEYNVWANMVARCSNPTHPSYHNYGGRGIGVCSTWLKFESFYTDMGDRPSNSHSLERVKNDIGYSKDNCRWATTQEQALNKRIRCDNSSGKTGVYFTRGKWDVQLYRDGVSKYIGSFLTFEEAVLARTKAEKLWENSMSQSESSTTAL